MLKSFLATALGAGVVAGLVAAALQFLLVIPLIHEAELYEGGTLTHFSAGAPVEAPRDHGSQGAHDHNHGHDHAHDHGAEDSLMRPLLTLISTLATFTGFALLLVAGFAFAMRLGFTGMSARSGLLWGLAGFAATQLMPAIGLAPELPGSAAADLQDRQLWWLFTAVSTTIGLAVLMGLRDWTRLLGVFLIALPHLFGAPHPEGYAGAVPPELAALFASRALAVNAIAWIALGAVAGMLWARDPDTA